VEGREQHHREFVEGREIMIVDYHTKDGPNFDPSVIDDKWCIDYERQKFAAASVFIFRTGTGVFTVKTPKPKNELMQFDKDDAQRTFRRALIHPEKFRREGGYQVT
jgi:hypothetical protein